ncbi:MAG: Uncharacterised protein [Cryomorphaceae bacterium]|nr:MAG: Uncharacterised protein [Cryomorphaceae bacterium]
MPFTNGSSGPTKTSSIFSVSTNSFMLSKSFTSILILVPTSAVPALPGAINNLLHELLFAIFHANACSLPPPPSINTFIL